MSDNNDTEKKQIPCSENIRNVTALVIKLFFIMALGSLLSTAHASDENTVSQIQLLLSLKGYDLSYRDSNGIDGKIGSKTLEAISAYKETLPINKRNTTDLIDLKKILEDDVRSGNTQPTLDKGNIEQSFKELKDELDKTKTDLNNLISKQSKQEKDYSKDMGLVNTGAIFVLTVLSIVLVLMGIAGIFVYKSTKKQLQHDMKPFSMDITTRIYTYLSEAFYLYYREFLNKPNNPAFNSGIALALRFNDGALLYANLLETEQPSEKNRAHLINAKTHRAYHLATRKFPEDIEEALSMINDIEEYSVGLLKKGDIENWQNIQIQLRGFIYEVEILQK
ncbi:hypothetical protein W03_25900 [Nitrosomonas sp. PY1]|uniref:hypothetical protein n=1 Tax=Nitrosomonas sp. PY1 TaxID=1803906 RepID=UPI001FC84418|nr:hypothetical protein [Nitrosomonas sp. PY1]GKS70586.1 hypothetical protein W03_25900 [Nitrosomonas sp. PY1]